MNNADFNRWLDDFCETFPDHGEWIAKMSAATQRKWREVFEIKKISVQDAIRANQAILCGDVPKIAAYERDHIAGAIVTAVAEIGRSGRKLELSEAECFAKAKREFTTSSWPAGKVFREVVRRIRDGRSAAEVTKEVCDELERTTIDREPRYKCLTCFDNLMVSCVSIRTVADLRAVAAGARNFGTCSVWCHCEAARLAADKRENAARRHISNEYKAEPVFDPMEHLRQHGDIARRAAEMLQERSERKRVKSFDAWNERATA